MNDPYLALLAGIEPGKEQALAQKLRGSDARSTLAQLSGDPVLMGYGRNQAQRDNITGLSLAKGQRERERVKAGDERAGLQRAMTQKYYDQLKAERDEGRKLQRAQAEEIKRYHEANEARWDADREARLEEARIRAAAKGTATKAIPNALQTTLALAGDEVKNMEELYQEIDVVKPGQEAIPLASTVKNYLAGQYGIGDDAAIKKSEWWNKFNRQWNIVKRNEKFGATLSENEKKDWKAATINEEMQMGQLKTVMNIMRQYAYWNRDRRSNAAKASGLYNEAEVDILAGTADYPGLKAPAPDPAIGPTPQGSPHPNRAGKLYDSQTGKWSE